MNTTPAMNRYRIFRRKSGIYFIQDNRTSKQESLKTRDREQAERIAFHKNEAEGVAGANRQIAIGYLAISDPEIKNRKWADVMKTFCESDVKASTLKRKLTAMKDKALKALAPIKLIETTPEHLLGAIRRGTVSTNCYLRKIHNLARRMKWLPDDVLTRGMWPVIRHGKKRAITPEEHRKILAATHTIERQKYYQVLWETGASQSDIARMTADLIDWENGTVLFSRMKVEHRGKGAVSIVMGPTLESLLASLPQQGCLFPTMAAVGENDRATVFSRTCERIGIEGVTLHSYRYSIVQRARQCGYNKRYAMAMVGHDKEQTHDEYAAGGALVIPSLEECELAFEAARTQRLMLQAERRKKIIGLQEYLSESKETDQTSAA